MALDSVLIFCLMAFLFAAIGWTNEARILRWLVLLAVVILVAHILVDWLVFSVPLPMVLAGENAKTWSLYGIVSGLFAGIAARAMVQLLRTNKVNRDKTR